MGILESTAPLRLMVVISLLIPSFFRQTLYNLILLVIFPAIISRYYHYCLKQKNGLINIYIYLYIIIHTCSMIYSICFCYYQSDHSDHAHHSCHVCQYDRSCQHYHYDDTLQ